MKKNAKRRTPPPAAKPAKKSASRWRLWLAGAAVGVVALVGLAFTPPGRSLLQDLESPEPGSQRLETIPLTLPDGKKLTVEVARTAGQREIGLMFRTKLAPNRGMLFVYDTEAPHTFWMKNTLIDLDMVFIGADKRVTSVAANVPKTTADTPNEAIPRRSGKGQYILEIPAGRAKELGIETGTELKFTP